MSNDLPRLRQQLWRAYAALAHTLRRLQRSQPMVQGSFYLLRRKCGKPNCRCATGQLHAAYVLTRSEAGKDRLYTVPKEQRARVRQWAAEYRRYQRARAVLVQTSSAPAAAGGSNGRTTVADLATEPGGAQRIISRLIEHHPQRVLEAFRRGEFDQIEIIGQADEKEFFELCFQEKMLVSLAQEMPTARKKEEVPLWFVLAANLSLKLHLENSFYAFERVVRCGGLLQALPPEIASKHLDPQTQAILLECQGFNDKNHYARTHPVRPGLLAQIRQRCPGPALDGLVQRAGAAGVSTLRLFRSRRHFRGRRQLSLCARQPGLRRFGGDVVR